MRAQIAGLALPISKNNMLVFTNASANLGVGKLINLRVFKNIRTSKFYFFQDKHTKFIFFFYNSRRTICF